MRKFVKNARYILLASILFSSLQCTKETADSQPVSQIPLTPEQLILGKWDLKYTLYKDPFDTFYLAQHNMKTTYEFFTNDTVLIDSYSNGIRDTFTSGKKHYLITPFILDNDTTPAVEINGSSLNMELSADTLTLDTRYKDGSYKFFTKLP